MSYEVTNLTEISRQYEQIILLGLLLGTLATHLLVRAAVSTLREWAGRPKRRPLVTAIVATLSGLAVASCGAPGGVEEAPATVETATPPGGPVSGTGRYYVGEQEGQIEPGRYVTAGAVGGGLCEWQRRHEDTVDRADAVIDSGETRGGATITIEESDGVFRTSGCQPWERR